MNLKKKSQKKLVSKVLAILFAGATFCAGVFPFILKLDKASAEGVSTSDENNFSYRNPFAGAVFSLKTQQTEGVWNSSPYITNSMPSVVYYTPNGDLDEFRRKSYQVGDYLLGNSSDYYFTDSIDSYGNNFRYFSKFTVNAPLQVRSTHLDEPLFSFSFQNCLMLVDELNNFTVNFRYLYKTNTAWENNGGWITDGSTQCEFRADLQLAKWTEFGFVFDDIPNPFHPVPNTFPFYSTKTQGYKSVFADYSRNPDYIFPVVIDDIEYHCVLASGSVACYPLVEGVFSVVNSSVVIYQPRTVVNYVDNSFVSYNLTSYNAIYDKFYYDRFAELEVERGYFEVQLKLAEKGTKVIFDTVQNFFDLEVFPEFKLSYLLMLGVGAVIFGFVLKVFLGG